MPYDKTNQDIRLTKNDKKVLHFLIERGRISDSEIARKLKITPQAILKIRSKLENAGIIEGFRPKVNYKKLGITVMAWAVLRYLPTIWEHYTEEQIREKLRSHPYIVWGCRIPESDATHILLYGFKDMKQMDHHFTRLQTKLSKIIEVKKIYTFSVEQLIKNTPQTLFHNIIDGKDFHCDTLFSDSDILKKNFR